VGRYLALTFAECLRNPGIINLRACPWLKLDRSTLKVKYLCHKKVKYCGDKGTINGSLAYKLVGEQFEDENFNDIPLAE